MKKVIQIVIAILLLILAGCSTLPEQIKETAIASPAPKEQPAAEPTIAPTPIVTTQPEPVVTVAQTPEPEGYSFIADGFCYYELTEEIKERIIGMSYPAGGSDFISYDDLRYIEILHYDFDGAVQQGELIVNKLVAKEVTQIFFELYKEQYPLQSVLLVDDYGEPGDDNLSMAANNTSAFNYRYVTGSSKLSRHSYGAAIDINPMFNPYIDGDRIVPQNGIEYADRSLGLPGMIDHNDLAYKLFIKSGWTWGGDWSKDKDYQHFSKDLGF